MIRDVVLGRKKADGVARSRRGSPWTADRVGRCRARRHQPGRRPRRSRDHRRPRTRPVGDRVSSLAPFSRGRLAVARRGAGASCGELLQHISPVWCSSSLLIRSLARAGPPHVQHLAWRRRVVDRGSTRTIREDAPFVLVLTPRECPSHALPRRQLHRPHQIRAPRYGHPPQPGRRRLAPGRAPRHH